MLTINKQEKYIIECKMEHWKISTHYKISRKRKNKPVSKKTDYCRLKSIFEQFFSFNKFYEIDKHSLYELKHREHTLGKHRIF